MYHYKECGLKNVHLLNGYRIVETPYGQSVSIENIEGLHSVIAESLVEDKPALTGPEFRFLRKYLEMSQKRVGQIAGATEQAVRYWEKLGRIPKWADHWIRAIFLLKKGDQTFEQLIDRLNSIDRADIERQWRFEDTEDGWRSAA